MSTISQESRSNDNVSTLPTRRTANGSATYTYDSGGNTMKMSLGWTCSHDDENWLVKVTYSGTTVQTNPATVTGTWSSRRL